MSRIRRMSNIMHYRISHHRKYVITKRTPIRKLNTSQRLRLHLLQVNTAEYIMQGEGKRKRTILVYIVSCYNYFRFVIIFISLLKVLNNIVQLMFFTMKKLQKN